jgi:hypothetical protein
MQLLAASEAMQMKRKDAFGHVERATDLARFGLSEARRSALSLRSDVIEESGLIEALRMLVERSNIPGLVRCSFRSSKVSEESLAPSVQQDLLRITQEAISNALRHARPTVISVSLRRNPPNLVLCSKSEITALESLRTGQVAKDWDLPICGHGQRILAPNWTFVVQQVAAPVSSFVYRLFHEPVEWFHPPRTSSGKQPSDMTD